MRRLSYLTLVGVLASAVASHAAPAPQATAQGAIRIAPGPDGGMGAWLVLGPFASFTHPPSGRTTAAVDAALTAAPRGIDEGTLAPRAGLAAGLIADRGGPACWKVAAGGDGLVDLNTALSAKGQTDVVAYAAATLHAARTGRHYLLLGCDDGVRVSVDGRILLTRDDPRPVRDADDVIPFDLTAGDHSVLLKLHQRAGAWAFRARFVDDTFAPEPGSYLELPGTTRNDALDLAGKMSWVSLDRGLVDDGFAPRLKVEFKGGLPLDVPLPVRVRLAPTGGVTPVFDVGAGDVPTKTAALTIALPRLHGDLLSHLEDRAETYGVDVAGRHLDLPFYPRRDVRQAVSRLDHALAELGDPSRIGSSVQSWLGRGSRESAERLRDRLVRYVGRGDTDLEAEQSEAREIDRIAAAFEKRADPFAARTGPIRRAYRSPLDGALSEYGVYVPPSYAPGTTRKYPLIVALHGLNGQPMEMIRWVFGGDDPKRDGYWEDRHIAMAEPPAPPLAPFEAFVVTPSGRGSTMYREQGEEDVLAALDEVLALYPIDLRRISVTGASMGGIGAALVPLRHPDRFAAAAPLCGYHSYFVRNDVRGSPLRPWERFLAETRSNAFWAENGARLPLYIVQGTLDLPEGNSGSLIERYVALKYDVKDEHPALGHNVWQTTYEKMKGAKWLLGHTTDLHPSHLRFRTAETRDGDDAWLHIEELAAPGAWGEVDARIRSRTAIDLTTKGVNALGLDRDDALIEASGPLVATIDGAPLSFPAGAPIQAHREGDAWVAGPRTTTVRLKHGTLAGPFRDVFRAPLLFVYGASDPAQTLVNERVTRAWAAGRLGVDLAYEVVSDVEFLARGEPLANDRGLFLVGRARSNQVVRALEAELPLHIDGDSIVLSSGERFAGREAGAAFIFPNPRRANRYVAVVEGVDATGTLRSLSLPDLLPDFVVYDAAVAPARGQLLLGPGHVLAGGFFTNDWSWPSEIADPLTKIVRPRPEASEEPTP